MNSTVFVGFHSAWASPAPTTPKTNAPANRAAADTTSGFSAFRDIPTPPGFAGPIDSRPALFHRFAHSPHCRSMALVFNIPCTKSEDNRLPCLPPVGVRPSRPHEEDTLVDNPPDHQFLNST